MGTERRGSSSSEMALTCVTAGSLGFDWAVGHRHQKLIGLGRGSAVLARRADACDLIGQVGACGESCWNPAVAVVVLVEAVTSPRRQIEAAVVAIVAAVTD